MDDLRPVGSEGMRTPHGWRYGLALAAVALVYFIAGRFGLSLAFGVKQVTAVWLRRVACGSTAASSGCGMFLAWPRAPRS